MKKKNIVCGAIGTAAVASVILGVTLAVRYNGSFPRAAGIVLIALGIAAIVFCLALLMRGEKLTTAKYARKKSLLTAAELEFLKVLRRIEPNKYEVIPQSALVSVIDKKTETAYRNELFRIIDYLFVDRNTFAPLLLVELNDSSHQRADRQLRDKKVEEICRKAKMPLVTFTTAEARDFALVKKRVLGEILKR